jgi:hypothetical protein
MEVEQKRTKEQVIDTLENVCQIFEREEDGELIGYDIETSTDLNINEDIFLDFTDTGKDPKNGDDIVAVYEQYFEEVDIDEKVDLYIGDEFFQFKDYSRAGLSIDLRNWKIDFERIFK